MNSFKNIKQESIGYHFFKASTLWQRQIKKQLSRLNLTHTQFVILANLLYLQDIQINQELLSKETNIDKMTLSSTIRLLEKKELIKRYTLENNKKKIYVKITNSAINLTKEAIKIVEQIDEEFFLKIKNKEQFIEEIKNLSD